MITGQIRDRSAVIQLEFVGAASDSQTHEASIDTGFNGQLTLPSELISALQLKFAGYRRGRLADGRVVVMNAYLAQVVWHGKRKDVLISETASTPLVGMSLLKGCRISMHVVEGGLLTISELSQ